MDHISAILFSVETTSVVEISLSVDTPEVIDLFVVSVYEFQLEVITD